MLKIFSIRDVKGDSYGALICLPTVGIAMRALSEIIAGRESPFAKYPEDYSLYELGTFDPSSGLVTALAVPLFHCSLLSLRPPVIPADVPAPALPS